jgi:hypothetical protein
MADVNASGDYLGSVDTAITPDEPIVESTEAELVADGEVVEGEQRNEVDGPEEEGAHLESKSTDLSLESRSTDLSLEKVKKETIRRDAFQHRPLNWVSLDELTEFITTLEEETTRAIQEQRYIDAKNTKGTLDFVMAERDKRTPPVLQVLPTGDDPGMHSANRRVQEWDETIEKFDEQTRAKVASMRRYQEKKFEDFELQWRDVMPEKYRRPSKKLLDLRENTPILAALGRFDEANAQKQMADRLELDEYQEAQRLLDMDYSKAKRGLMSKFEGDLRSLIQNREEQRSIFLARRKDREESAQNRTLVLSNKPVSTTTRSMSTNRSLEPVNWKKNFFPAEPVKRLPPLRPPNAGGPSSRNSQMSKRPPVDC